MDVGRGLASVVALCNSVIEAAQRLVRSEGEQWTISLYRFMYSRDIRSLEKRYHAVWRHTAGSSLSTHWMASAISSGEFTRNPVRPCSTISLSAPDGNVITGVPQANASMATNELVSATRLGTSTHRACVIRRRFILRPKGPT